MDWELRCGASMVVDKLAGKLAGKLVDKLAGKLAVLVAKAHGCIRGRGGTGRRAGLRIPWPKGRAGSIPVARI